VFLSSHPFEWVEYNQAVEFMEEVFFDKFYGRSYQHKVKKKPFQSTLKAEKQV
jgi:hypothetical protein